ncbi:MAG: hypothetical protein KBS99_06315 [Prevotellaceae bacterium]|nr:hypothetical protein [Candidatus Colivivens caballi]
MDFFQDLAEFVRYIPYTNPVALIIISILLIGMILCQWKQRSWVKMLGIGALAFAVLFSLYNLSMYFDDYVAFGMSTIDIANSLRPVASTLYYGLLVYLVSLILRMVNKPRI